MPYDLDLKGLRVAVTGGTSGLGLALVRRHEPPRSAGRLHRALGSFSRACRKGNWRVRNCRRRLLQGGDPSDRARDCLELWGPRRADQQRFELGPDAARLACRHGMRAVRGSACVNLVGPFRLTKALLGALAASAREGRGAVIVNVSSDAAVNPYPGWAPMAQARPRSCI